MSTEAPVYKKKDFVSDQEVRWCPGCGDYAILNGVQQAFAGLGVAKENFCVVSGIGCSSRFPYYMDTYGFHTIHGRAPAVATGVKVANPELDVWVVTGDGDALSIGGNHLIHAMRRNLNIKVLLFNNRIYGLTKGQYSPTTVPGKKTPSTPYGSLDAPFNPIAIALGAGSTFVARTVDTQIPHLKQVIQAAHEHQGFAFVEILQNCVIFQRRRLRAHRRQGGARRAPGRSAPGPAAGLRQGAGQGAAHHPGRHRALLARGGDHLAGRRRHRRQRLPHLPGLGKRRGAGADRHLPAASSGPAWTSRFTRRSPTPHPNSAKGRWNPCSVPARPGKWSSSTPGAGP